MLMSRALSHIYLFFHNYSSVISILLGYLLHLPVQGHQVTQRMFPLVFIAEEANGVGDKGSGGTTTVDVQTCPRDWPASLMKLLSGKKY